MNATPENFKPGERWLFMWDGIFIETICREWSPSSDLVMAYFPNSEAYQKQWRRPNTLGQMYERLPDVEGESGNHKTESKSGVEAPCGECACCKWVIEKQRKKIYEAIEKGGIKYEGEEGKTFSVITGIEAEIEKRKRD